MIANDVHKRLVTLAIKKIMRIVVVRTSVRIFDALYTLSSDE